MNRSILMSELGVRPKLRFWDKMSRKQTQKNGVQGIQLLCSRTQNTILGQDEQETHAKNRTSRNSASKLTNPLQMVKKTFQAFESLNSDVRVRS